MHRAFLVIVACSIGCGGQVLGDGQGTDDNGTIDNDSGVAHADSGSNVVAKGKCPSGLPGPALIPLEENGGIPYCIDATEISNEQYAQFLATNPQVDTSVQGCAAEQTLAPEFGWPSAAADANRPVVNVDWCDAHQYCAWAGKKLCGAPGGVSGKYLDDQNSDTSLWYSACSNLGERTFPYGESYAATTCNGADDQNGQTLDVDLPATCTDSDASQILDMSGNVWEWEDTCDTAAGSARCRLRGGSFRSNQDSLTCAAADYSVRTSRFDDFGFRCCAE